MKGRITSTEIAEMAGVSRATVSYILNGHAERERIPQATVERILRIANEQFYRPNGAARAMRRQRFDCVSLMMGSAQKAVWLPLGLLRNLQREVAVHGMHLNLSELPDSKLLSPEFAPKMLRELLADGLLINYIEDAPQGLEEMLQGYAIPHIWLNDIRPHDSIYPDDFGGASQGIKLLAELGHRRIAYISGKEGAHYSIQKRLEGARHAAASNGIELVEILVHAKVNRAQFRQRIERMLRVKNRPTACLAYSNTELQVCQVVAIRQGIRVPDELSLLTFDINFPVIGDLIQSSLVIPQKEMARDAIDLLLRKIANPKEKLAPIAVPYPEDAGGETCVPPSRA